jgi:hypothetical protein
MASMFGPSPTPIKYTYNYSRGGSPYYGDKTAALYGFGGLPERTSLLKILKESDHLQLYGGNGMNGLGNPAEVATSAAVTTGVLTGVVMTGLIISYVFGRYVGSFVVEGVSGSKLSLKQKRGIGVAAMII